MYKKMILDVFIIMQKPLLVIYIYTNVHSCNCMKLMHVLKINLYCINIMCCNSLINIYNILNVHSPGQCPSLHAATSFASPTQSCPSGEGDGLSHDLLRVLKPLSHTVEQFDHAPQSDHAPSERI